MRKRPEAHPSRAIRAVAPRLVGPGWLVTRLFGNATPRASPLTCDPSVRPERLRPLRPGSWYIDIPHLALHARHLPL
jgi:hypothetical protein